MIDLKDGNVIYNTKGKWYGLVLNGKVINKVMSWNVSHLQKLNIDYIKPVGLIADNTVLANEIIAEYNKQRPYEKICI